jgi:hypothetical protein
MNGYNPPYGDILQWTDLYSALVTLGMEVDFAVGGYVFSSMLRIATLGVYDIVVFDYVGHLNGVVDKEWSNMEKRTSLAMRRDSELIGQCL